MAKKKTDDDKRVNTSLRLTKKTLKNLKVAAAKHDTSIQQLISTLIEDYLKKEGKSS